MAYVEKINKDVILIDDGTITFNNGRDCWDIETFVDTFLSHQTGDKVFLPEEFRNNEYGDIEYRGGFTTPVTSILNANQWQPKENMTYEQSRYKFTIVVEIVSALSVPGLTNYKKTDEYVALHTLNRIDNEHCR